MAIPVSASINQLNAEVFLQEGYELSLDAIVPSIELTGSFSPIVSKTQFYIYNYSKTLLYENLDYNANGSFLPPAPGTTISTSTSSYNQFELNPVEDIYNQGYSSGNYYAVYNFIDYDLGSELIKNEEDFSGHPYFIKDISGDRTELRIQNNFLSTAQIQNYYNQFTNKINNRENADEFYVSFSNNRNFIGVNSKLELPSSGSNLAASVLIKLYKPLPVEFKIDDQLQVITKVGESLVFSIDFQPNLEFIDNLLQLKGPNYNINIKDKINNSTNYKTLNDLINTNSSESFYQFNSLRDQKGIVLRKNFGDWNEFVKYSSAEQRLNNFYDKMVSIESYNAELLELEGIGGGTPGTPDYSSSYNNVTNNINKIISKFDSYEYFLYYITGSESWPKYTSTYPYTNYSVSSSAVLNWFGSTNELSQYYNSGKNQIYSASRYDNNNQDYLYYLIPPFITENLDNNQYIKFVNMVGQTFDEVYLYTEAVEQVRNTNSGLTGSVLPLGLADEVIESLGFEVGGNSFNSVGFNPNNIGVYPTAGSGLEYIDRYIDIASGSVINYYDQDQSTLGYVIALADPSFPYPIENSSQEIYKRIFHNMVSLVKRKGTVTGLRQLINVWGVPNTMLRISEFGGKNKDDENDYDLWMNRYSNALTTYNYKKGALLPSGSIRIPWTPLTANYYQTETYGASNPDIAVPDCIQFRFKNDRPIGTNSLFTSSLLVKNHLNSINYSDFGITLQYSGSNSGSYSGSVLPTDYQYGTMQFIISGSVAEGAKSPGYFESDPITLPFFDGGWWSVQLQRKTHLSASNQNNNTNEYELKVANNIYDGYDGNQVGFTGSTSITMPDSKVTQSINEAWNKFSIDASLPSARGVILGGYMTYPNGSGLNNTIIGGSGGRGLGTGFSGSFQEFRYYRRAMSASSFNDYVMNPESIQGHSDSNTGEGSSYDLLSYRLPLGNELEYINMSGSAGFTTATENTKAIGILKFGGTPDIINFPSFGANALGSVHPSLVNKKGSLYTSSFLYMTNYNTGSGYTIVYQGWDGTDTSAVTASYLAPNTQINYMDQPAAGLRNRIKNKIQVIDGNEYGTILSPFRSIQQEFEQSGSYTEDINSLEVGFSFQNEINDDIIGTFGHGVVSDAIADPRFISESSDRYPELTRIAEDYFKKYQGTAITDPTYNGGLPTIIEKEFDYNRLIKFYETSLFKAIKNYVPARTSLSTGIIVKQHLLERNKTHAITGMTINSPIAKTPETGSDVYGYTDQTGFNSVISQRNLLITSSIPIGSLTGSAGGSDNKYNILRGTTGSKINMGKSLFLTTTDRNITNYYDDFSGNEGYFQTNGDFFQGPEIPNEASSALTESQFFTVLRPLDVQYRFKASSIDSNTHVLTIVGSKRGIIFTKEFDGTVSTDADFTSPVLTLMPEERYKVLLRDTFSSDSISDITSSFNAYNLTNTGPTSGGGIVGNPGFSNPTPPLSSSQQAWFYLDDFTGDYKIKNTQDEFYNGEYSGSEFRTIPTPYNPYRIFADGNDKTPDDIAVTPAPYIDFTQGGAAKAGVTYTVASPTEIRIQTVGSSTGNGDITYSGSFFNLIPGVTYRISASITQNGDVQSQYIITNTTQVGGINFWQGNASSNSGTTQINFDFVATNNGVGDTLFQPYTTGPGAGFDNGGIGNILATSADIDNTIEIHSITTANTLGPKHFYKNDGFTIVPSQSQLFQNSPYNPIINNVSGSRENEKYLDMDFDAVEPGAEQIQFIPNDYTLTVSASQLGWEGTATNTSLLEYSTVPESNYTILSSANSRYNGTLIQSADYNFYTGLPSASQLTKRSKDEGITGLANTPRLLAQHKVKYINGETGSWLGDISYGKTAVIDRNPIYFGHFNQSYSEPSIFNTTTFVLDQLIQVPFDEILTEQSPIITSSLINGSNENLIPVSSTFGVNRKASIFYTNAQKRFAEFNNLTLHYNTIQRGSFNIFAPASDFISYFSNQIENNSTTQTINLSRPQWEGAAGGGSPLATPFNITSGRGGGQFISSLSPTVELLDDTEILPLISASAINIFTTGSSDYARSKGLGILTLLGPSLSSLMKVRVSIGTAGSGTEGNTVIGPSLAFFNSVNHNTLRGNQTGNDVIAGVSPGAPLNTTNGFCDSTANAFERSQTGSWFGSIAVAPQTTGLQIPGFNPGVGNLAIPVITDVDNIQNYYRQNFSQSGLFEYTQNTQRFMIEEGDEIRVSYRFPSQNSTAPVQSNDNFEIVTQDFKVIEYEMAPPTVQTKDFDIPGGGSTFVIRVDETQLITSSAPPYKNMALQIDEYKRRMDIAIQNRNCFFLMSSDAQNATAAGCGSGSFITNAQYDSYITNFEGESRPTEIKLTIQRNRVRLPNVTSGPSHGFGWLLGTNMSGVDDWIKENQFGTGSLVTPRRYGSTGTPPNSSDTPSDWNTQRKLFVTDGEDINPKMLAFDAGFVWNRLLVDPAPDSIPKPIPSGSIITATLRKRVSDDRRVVINLSPLSGSRGIATPSGDGYLIPDDLTPIQQANVQKIINKLQSENVFQQNTPDNVS